MVFQKKIKGTRFDSHRTGNNKLEKVFINLICDKIYENLKNKKIRSLAY